jgi:hypothetical protein
MESHVDDKEHPSNPENEHLQHIFTFLTSWDQIEKYMLKKMDEIDRSFPPRAAPPLSSNNVYAKEEEYNHFTSNNAGGGGGGGGGDGGLADGNIPRSVVDGVLDGLQQRLNYPLHERLNRQATMNTLSYLYNHMRCGIYVMIRSGKVRVTMSDSLSLSLSVDINYIYNSTCISLFAAIEHTINNENRLL